MGSYDLRSLSGIDEGGGEFTGLIDTECAIEVLALLLIKNVSRLRVARGSGCRCMSALSS